MKLLAAGVAAVLVLGAVALAPAQQRPCADDLQRLCPEVTPGGGAVAACLGPHLEELTPACRRFVQRVQRRRSSLAGRKRQVRTARAKATAPATPAPTPASVP